MASREQETEAFPSLSPAPSGTNTPEPKPASTLGRSPKTPSINSSRKTRSGSIRQSFINSNPPLGMWQATGEVSSKIPTLSEIKNGAFSAEGWSHEGQMEHRGNNPHDIHRRRMARTSSASTRTRKSSLTPATPTTPAIEEEGEGREFFPHRATISQRQPVIEEASVEPNSLQQKPTQSEKTPVTGLAATAASSSSSNNAEASRTHTGPDDTGTYPNGYRFPRKHTWTESTVISAQAFWKFFLTPFGFLITVYGLNIVGWGAMIFFVLLEAAPALCHPSCSDENSPRKIWIEIDSQVLNGLFCVTGFGLIPWRFRDFYYLMRWRVFHDMDGHRRLAGLYRGWYRLPGSDHLPQDMGPPPLYSKKHPHTEESPPPYSEDDIHHLAENTAIPLPPTSMPEPPLTGLRAAPSRSWTLDFVIWMYMWNTIFQAFLAAFMWAYNRHNRPSWCTGLFITLGCLTGIFAGICVFIEGSRVKKIEGIPIQEYDHLESIEEYHDRKAKEDAKLEKKESKHLKHEIKHNGKHQRQVMSSEKVKGHQWFTRH